MSLVVTGVDERRWRLVDITLAEKLSRDPSLSARVSRVRELRETLLDLGKHCIGALQGRPSHFEAYRALFPLMPTDRAADRARRWPELKKHITRLEGASLDAIPVDQSMMWLGDIALMGRAAVHVGADQEESTQFLLQVIELAITGLILRWPQASFGAVASPTTPKRPRRPAMALLLKIADFLVGEILRRTQWDGAGLPRITQIESRTGAAGRDISLMVADPLELEHDESVRVVATSPSVLATALARLSDETVSATLPLAAESGRLGLTTPAQIGKAREAIARFLDHYVGWASEPGFEATIDPGALREELELSAERGAPHPTGRRFAGGPLRRGTGTATRDPALSERTTSRAQTLRCWSDRTGSCGGVDDAAAQRPRGSAAPRGNRAARDRGARHPFPPRRRASAGRRCPSPRSLVAN